MKTQSNGVWGRLQAAMVAAGLLFTTGSSYATEQAQQRREGRDTRQDTRQEAHQTKVDCRAADQKNNAECRQDKRDAKQGDVRRHATSSTEARLPSTINSGSADPHLLGYKLLGGVPGLIVFVAWLYTAAAAFMQLKKFKRRFQQRATRILRDPERWIDACPGHSGRRMVTGSHGHEVLLHAAKDKTPWLQIAWL